MNQDYSLGIDVGSTTVKYVLCDDKLNICAKEYTPHNTKQAATLLELLKKLSKTHQNEFNNIKKVYITGSGASLIAPLINAKFVQEVNAVVLAVEYFHPDVNSVIELGGQDAKIIHFKTASNGKKSVFTSMNDKCASGTGATIQKCVMKVGMTQDEVQKLSFDPRKLHHVAAKCGVFAETDIVNLIKASVPSEEIMNSLADAIVMQNLTVLTRGNTLMPKVLLLGGPNTYLPFLQECWRMRISELWDERMISYDKSKLDELIVVPQNSQYYAAYGAIIFGQEDRIKSDTFCGLKELEDFVNFRTAIRSGKHDKPLVSSKDELEKFKKEYKIPPFAPKVLNQKTECYLGIDGGSTSSKAVLIDKNGTLLFKAYQLSKGNPIQDTLDLLNSIREYDKNRFFDIRGLGVTGYAADVLEGALIADANIVETIAHMKSAQHIFGNSIDVICDIGGQDIKVLFLENGMMKNFRLSNQCSAGNGTLLQSMAAQFGVKIEEYANVAFKATLAPKFNYGCAVFLDTDRVNFQKEGYSKEELFAGIAKVLPKNVWQYVVQAPNLATLGKHYVLQGGTQYNLAALKAQVDYIKEQVPQAKIDVHPYCGEAGAYGAALEARLEVSKRGYTKFIGFDEALKLSFTTKTDESTRCNFCDIKCSRTFIDTKTPNSNPIRYIAGFACEKGMVESTEALKKLYQKKKELQKRVPNLVEFESKYLFKPFYEIKNRPTKETVITQQKVKVTLNGWGPTFRKSVKRKFEFSKLSDKEYRKSLKIAIPKVLNIYSIAPFLRVYLEALDIDPNHIIFSDFSNEDMYLEGAKYGSVDPCYPAKVAQSHVYSLMFDKKFIKKGIDFIWFPSVVGLLGYVEYAMAQTSCPVVSGTPKVVYSAFTKEINLFKKAKIGYIDDALNFDNITLLKKQLFNTFKNVLKITEDESNWATQEGLNALKEANKFLENRGREILHDIVENDEIAILLLSRPYHSDPGLNHEILNEFQSLGFKVLSMNSIPKDQEYLEQFFGDDIKNGYIKSYFDIRDVWPENFSTNSAQKVWAAKFASRHPNIAVVDLSSFKCGHDAPTYAIIDKILSMSKTPHLMLHDIDANKPSGSFKIRIKTFAYTLREYKRDLKYNRIKIDIRQKVVV